MKRLRTLLMVLAMALCLSGLSFAAEAGAIEPIDDGSVAAPQLYAGESSTAPPTISSPSFGGTTVLSGFIPPAVPATHG